MPSANWRHHGVLAITGVSLVLGALLGVQFHTQELRGSTVAYRKTNVLAAMLTANQAQVEAQNKEIEQLREQVAEYEKEAASGKGMVELMTQQLQNSRIAVGLVAVQGPGIELQLGDSTMRPVDADAPQDVWVIHNVDLVTIANELWAAGAEAVALNGQRLGVGSAITCSGRLIQVNNTSISSPFIFHAIGNKEHLMSALNIRGGVLDTLRLMQFEAKLTPKDELVISPISITPSYSYAKAVKQEKES